jgi:thiamine pyrophosphate-dependent acetolactate synthase large subunit-like protein
VDGGELVSRVLESQKVKYLFAINGGHTFPILATLRQHGIKLIHMRHEQACAYAADAYARTTGMPGVCSVTAGCGLTNAVTGLCGGWLGVQCLHAGQHPNETEDQIGSSRRPTPRRCRTFSKFTKRVLDWSTIEVDLRQAQPEATVPPQGPSRLET